MNGVDTISPYDVVQTFSLHEVNAVRSRRKRIFRRDPFAGSFIPLELSEIARRPDVARAALCLVNVAIVWYLAPGLRRRD